MPSVSPTNATMRHLCHCNSSSDLDVAGPMNEKLERMQNAVKILLEEIGEDLSREGLIDTPRVSLNSSRWKLRVI